MSPAPITMPNRRKFIAAVFGGTLGSAVPGWRAWGEPNSKSAIAPRAGYFDIHVHLTQGWFGEGRGPLTARALLHWMDAHQIAQVAVLPLVSPEAFWYPVTTEYVLRETAPYRDRLIPFVAIDPRRLATHLTDQRQLVDMLSRYRDAGARGFGEHKPRLPVDDLLNMRLFEACSELGLPVLLHLDNQANIDRPGLPGLAKVLEAFPKLTVIGHGKGWWASIAGGLSQRDLHVGYPKGPVAPGGAIDQLMDRFDNLYGDLSSSGAHALLRDRPFGKAFIERRADRLLFGTDYYDLKQVEFSQFSLFEKIQVSSETRDKISRDNARRILGLT
jgi:predicted TIM-barrel fold metal-dependent hydrolase